MTILITGVSGMIGYGLALKAVARQKPVLGIDLNISPEMTELGLDCFEVDLTDLKHVDSIIKTNNVTQILHAGGISGPMLLADTPYKVFDINCNGTLNILESARLNNVTRIVFLSSFVTYGDQINTSEVSEDLLLNGTNPYAASKIAAETLVNSYSDKFNLETINLRLGAVFGPRRTTDCLIRTFLEDAINQKHTLLPYGKNWARPYVYLDDVVEAIFLALEAPIGRIKDNAYNIAGGVWPTLSEISAIVSEVTGCEKAFLEEGKTPNDYLIGPLNLTRAKRDLSYSPTCSLKDGITLYYQWLLNQ